MMTDLTRLSQLKSEVAATIRRLVTRGLTTTTGGNVSARDDHGVIYITPSQIDKEYIVPEQVGVITAGGVALAAGLKLSMETAMHQRIYTVRGDVKAVVHAHPPWATSFTVLGPDLLKTDLIAETWAMLGQPVWVPYALMGTQDLADRVGEAVTRGDILLLEKHGIIAVGAQLWQAFSRLEAIEEAAKLSVITSLMGRQQRLSGDQKTAIDLLMGR
jgi:L-fuculose-phosphate aldolase